MRLNDLSQKKRKEMIQCYDLFESYNDLLKKICTQSTTVMIRLTFKYFIDRFCERQSLAALLIAENKF